MPYKSSVLASRPTQYYTLDSVNGNKDLSGLGNDLGTLTSFFSPLVPGYSSSLITGTIPNPLQIFSNDRPARDFCIEFWNNPAIPNDGNTSRKFIGPSGVNSGVWFEQDRYKFIVNDALGNQYYADFPVPSQDGRYHVVATFIKNTILLIVNGVVGYPTALPNNFTFSGSYATLTYTNPGYLSHLAIYNRVLSIDEITSHYISGNTNWGYREVCLSDGGDFYGMSSENTTYAFNEEFQNSAWTAGSKQNVVIDRDGYLTLPEQANLVTYDGGLLVSPTYAASKLSLGSTIYALKSDVMSAISSTGGIIAGTMASASAPSTVKVIMTVVNKNSNKSWSWAINSTNHIVLTVIQQNQDGTSTTNAYTYDSTVSNGSNYYVFWIEQGRVKIHTGGTAAATNQVSGVDWVYEDIRIDHSTQVIFGANGDFTGPSVDSLSDIYFWNALPQSFSGDYTTLATVNGATCRYPLVSDLVALSKGVWTYNFSVPFEGAYSGHALSWSGNKNSGMVVQTSYNSSSYTTVTINNQPFTNFPISGTLGTTQVNGPFSIKVTLQTETTGQRPRLESIRFRVYANNNFKAAGTSDTFTSQTLGTGFSPEYHDPSMAIRQPTALFIAADRLEFPSQTYKTIEFVYTSGANNGEILCARELVGDAERSVSRSGDALVWTGFDSVYLNGASVASGAAVTRDMVNHVVALYSTGFTHKINFGAHYDGTLNPLGSGLLAVAVYDRVLTTAEISEHYNASHGLIQCLSDVVDPISFSESTAPHVYSYAWQMTGAPK